MADAEQQPTNLTINHHEVLRAYLNRDFGTVANALQKVLEFFRVNTFVSLHNPADRLFIQQFVNLLLFLFTRPDFQVPPSHIRVLIEYNAVITSLVRLTPHRTTDAALQELSEQPANLAKMLVLLSPYSTIPIPPARFFDADPVLASFWYFNYFKIVEGYPSRQVHENMRAHLQALDPDRLVWQGPGEYTFALFQATYIDPEHDAPLKQALNRLVQGLTKKSQIINRPNPRKIAVISGRWYRSSAVYKSCAPFIATLKDSYDLTLIQLGAGSDNFDQSWFKDIRSIRFDGATLPLEAIEKNDFGMVYYPDIGMAIEDRYLSNLRIAPVQVVGYGHPVSTRSPFIDYFVVGQESELLDRAEENYSERVVAIPGLGAFPVKSDVTGIDTTPQTEPLIINCPWSAQKINYEHLTALHEIIQQVNCPIRFRFFPTWPLKRNNAWLPFKMDICEVLGEQHCEVMLDLQPHEYLVSMAQGTFSIDSYPFGGYNTIIDSLQLGKPVITLEGTRFINRASSAIMRRVGLAELIATSRADYIRMILDMIHNDAWRESLVKRIRNTDLDEALFHTDEPGYFKKAIDYLMHNHKRLKAEKSRKPIIIS